MTASPAGSASSDGRPAHERAAVWGPRLVRLLDRQVALYTDLSDLANTQSELIASGDATAVIGVLAKRQVIIDQIAEVNTEMTPMQTYWQERSDELADVDRESVRERTACLARLVGEIQARDDADRKSLEKQRDRVRRELDDTNRGQSAMAAYAEPRPMQPRFQDRSA